MPNRKSAYRLATATGALAKLLGPSEVEIMRILWTHGPQKVNAVHRRITAARGVVYTTLMTTMEHLVKKGLLQRGNRQGVDGVYVYTPTIGEQEFVVARLADILSVIERDEPAALAQEMDARPPA
jgi:BlaI family transcriptional regulator, penicillinase repressor